jgi:hypothetical protein
LPFGEPRTAPRRQHAEPAGKGRRSAALSREEAVRRTLQLDEK